MTNLYVYKNNPDQIKKTIVAATKAIDESIKNIRTQTNMNTFSEAAPEKAKFLNEISDWITLSCGALNKTAAEKDLGDFELII